MQGAYRVWDRGRQLIERFVAAPGPMGWRYFSRVGEAQGEPELFNVDFVVDAAWGLVRFRSLQADGRQTVVVPVFGGLEVAKGYPGEERSWRLEGASAVWSSSPWSLHVATRLLAAGGGEHVIAAELGAGDPAAVVVTVRPAARSDTEKRSAISDAQSVQLVAGDLELSALLGPELPLAATGWFELIEREGIPTPPAAQKRLGQ